MLDLESGRRAIKREYDALIDKLSAASDEQWTNPVRCVGWTVKELAEHVSGFGMFMADIMDRMRQGITEAAPRPERTPPPRPELLDMMRAGREKLYPVLDALTTEDVMKMAPFPFASLPGFVGLQIAAVEAGLHHNDLEWALGREVALPDDIADAAHTTVGPMMQMLAANASEKPTGQVAYRVACPSSTVSMYSTESGWEQGDAPAGAPVCEVSGDDSSVALYLLGRIPADHPTLKTTDPALAGKLKAYFPGP
jgi:uncharacterized protein (TIGR03083 family)